MDNEDCDDNVRLSKQISTNRATIGHLSNMRFTISEHKSVCLKMLAEPSDIKPIISAFRVIAMGRRRGITNTCGAGVITLLRNIGAKTPFSTL